MAQLTITALLDQADRLGLSLIAGPIEGPPITRVEIASVDSLDDLPAGTLVVVTSAEPPSPFRVDIAIRQASARGWAALLFTTELALAATATDIADRGNVPVLVATGLKPSELALTIDRMVSGGASETMTRAAYAIEQVKIAAAASADRPLEAILAAAGESLGVAMRIADDPSVTWTDSDAVFIGEVPIGRLTSESADGATAVALPVIASILSRSMHREVRDRFAPKQSRADLIVQLVLAESSRISEFSGHATRLGLPLQLSHVVGWLKPTHRTDPALRPPNSLQPALELFALRLVDERTEMWHVAFLQDDLVLVATEEPGAGDHQRRLREVASTILTHARSVAGPEWDFTLGLGAPQVGAAGLRQSAAEARVAAEAAVAGGRAGSIEVTDVTGLRRVLLDFYASPTSRKLLHDILHPLDELGPERALTAVRTLLSYLGNRNSLARAGQELTLHPNAVGYRMKRIQETLQLDLADPDIRFAVELACRVRMLGAGTL